MKQKPMPFQAETVKAAVFALTHRKGPADSSSLMRSVLARLSSLGA